MDSYALDIGENAACDLYYITLTHTSHVPCPSEKNYGDSDDDHQDGDNDLRPHFGKVWALEGGWTNFLLDSNNADGKILSLILDVPTPHCTESGLARPHGDSFNTLASLLSAEHYTAGSGQTLAKGVVSSVTGVRPF